MARPAHENGESGDAAQSHARYIQIRNPNSKHTVGAREPGERYFGRWQILAELPRDTTPTDPEIPNPSPVPTHYNHRPAHETSRLTQDGPRAGDFRPGCDMHFRRYFHKPRRQPNEPPIRSGPKQNRCGDYERPRAQ